MPICLRKDTIILDLDNTLIHAVDPTELHVETSDIISMGVQVGAYLVFIRPHCIPFLEHCFRTYKKVILWSMGTRAYVEDILNLIKVNHNIEFHEVYTRDEFPKSKNVALLDVSQHRTLFLDDIPSRIINLADQNVIEAIPFYYQDSLTDTYLYDLMNFMLQHAI